MKNRIRRLKQWLVRIWVGAVLSGCAAMVPWDILTFPGVSGPIPGALNIGDSRPPVLRRCIQAFNSYPNCDYGFTDSNQKVVDIFSVLLESLDTYAEKTSELRPWVNKINMKNAPDPEKVPYRMFLLTISPSIVLVVPIAPKASDYYRNSCSTLLYKGCIQSQGFRGNAYWFHESPPVVSGSFWFTTEDRPGSVHYLNEGKSEHDILVGKSIVRLSQANSHWEVHRVK